MTDDAPRDLSDNEVHDRLVAAVDALGERSARTVRGRTALEAGRRALRMLQFALLKAEQDEADQLDGVVPPESPERA